MQKKSPVFAFALAALFSNVFAQNINEMQLDVIIRDFPVGHRGFEEFDAERGNGGECTENSFSCWGNISDCRNGSAYASNGEKQFSGRKSNWKSENAICFTGDRYHPCSEGGSTLRYGQDDYDKNASTGAIRGFCNGPDKEEKFGSSNCNGLSGEDSIRTNWGPNKKGWSNPVGVTKGMVEEWLYYDNCRECGDDENDITRCYVGEKDAPQYLRGRYCARPAPKNGECYGDRLNEWFTDGGSAKTITDVMTLKRVRGNLFEIKYDYNTRTDWNGFGEDMGYFPLDKYPDSETWKKQSLNVWCPKDLGSNDANYEDCKKWRDNFWDDEHGPKNGGAAEWAVNEKGIEKRKWHNYGFTMAGSGEFKYEEGAGDEFKFISSDDMWVFLDGKLAVDLGGVHLSAPGKIKIDEWASKEGWENESYHVINFFYANRQTESSEMIMAITELKPPCFGRN